MGRPITLKFSLRSASESEDGDSVEANNASEDGDTVEDKNTSEENIVEWLLLFSLLSDRSMRIWLEILLQFWNNYCYKEHNNEDVTEIQ